MRVVGADEARWEDEWDAKFFNLEGKHATLLQCQYGRLSPWVNRTSSALAKYIHTIFIIVLIIMCGVSKYTST